MKVGIEVGQCASADDCDTAVEPILKTAQKIAETVANLDSVWGHRKINQRAIEIEK